jgi:threonine dehydrogenase-like Zn-dependent dehydrogenase
MKAVVLRQSALTVEDLPELTPGAGQVLARTVACGICGSDLHFLHHGHKMLALGVESGNPSTVDLSKNIVMGHEFCAQLEEIGPDTYTTAKPGDFVVSMPVMLTGTTIGTIGYSNEFIGGYSEKLLLSGPLLLTVPNGLNPEHAACTEPMAVGLHAVNQSGITIGDAAVVHGCGPVGLAVIASLRLKGIESIIASDFSPARRALASTMGATTVVDPRAQAPLDAWLADAGPQAPRQSYAAGSGSGLLQFECVGVPGMINETMKRAPKSSTLTVVGVCMETDSFQPMFGINKELRVNFVLAYTPEEFAATLRHIAEGDIDVAPILTGRVPLDGVAQAFTDLANPELHAKILVVPSL